MRKGTPNRRQSCLDQYFGRRASAPRGGGAPQPGNLTARALHLRRTLHSPSATATPSSVEAAQRRELITVETGSSASSSSSLTLSSSSSKQTKKKTKRSPSGGRGTRRHSPESVMTAVSSTSSTAGGSSTTSTASYPPSPSSPLAEGLRATGPAAAPAARPFYKPAAHAVFLTPPETKQQKLAHDALAYGQRSVLLPWSSRNQCEGEAGQACQAWALIEHILRQDVTQTSSQLCSLLQALLVHVPVASASRTFSFAALGDTIAQTLSAEEQRHFFADVLPWMRRTVCAAPAIFGSKRIPLLRQGVNGRLLLRSEEAVTLMCCAFFSLFPGRSREGNHTPAAAQTRGAAVARSHSGRHHTRRGGPRGFGVSAELAPVNFDSLFSSATSTAGRDAHRSKIRCLLQYFMTSCEMTGDASRQSAIEITRVSYERMPDFAKSRAPLQPVCMRRSGLIEEDSYSLQVDFANKTIGGGVLGRGCVQEEIRFVVSPELLLSRLVCETLKDNEAVFISGCGQFSSYTGYASSFRFSQPLLPTHVKRQTADGCPSATEAIRTARVAAGRTRLPMRDVCVVAMDAVDFNSFHRRPEDQFDSAWIGREMRKAFISFRGTTNEFATLSSAREGPIATGNWGCGAFGGDVELKLLIQWCAASEAGRPLHYFVFDRAALPDTFTPVQAKLAKDGWTVGDVVLSLEKYAAFRKREIDRVDRGQAAAPADPFATPPPPPCPPKGLFEFILTA